VESIQSVEGEVGEGIKSAWTAWIVKELEPIVDILGRIVKPGAIMVLSLLTAMKTATLQHRLEAINCISA
jgi:hypothetical protein